MQKLFEEQATVNFRTSDHQRKALERIAEIAGVSVSDAARYVIYQGIKSFSEDDADLVRRINAVLAHEAERGVVVHEGSVSGRRRRKGDRQLTLVSVVAQ